MDTKKILHLKIVYGFVLAFIEGALRRGGGKVRLLPEEAMAGSAFKLAEAFCGGTFDDGLTLFAIGYEPDPAESTERIKFSIEAQFEQVEKLRQEIKALLTARFGVEALRSIDDFCQVVSELVNNSVEHGGCSIMEGELVFGDHDASFTLTTDGVRFDPTTAAADMPDFDQYGDLPEGGYGLAIINKLSDTFTYKYLRGRNMATVGKLFMPKNA